MVDGSSWKVFLSSLRGCQVSDSGVDELATYKARLKENTCVNVRPYRKLNTDLIEAL
jgi:hypothetical protein